MPVPLDSGAAGSRFRGMKIIAAAIGLFGFLLGFLSWLPWLGSIHDYLKLGMVTSLGIGGCLVITANWVARKPITFQGSIVHSERPVAYHWVSAVGFLFALFLAAAGLHGLLKWVVS